MPGSLPRLSGDTDEPSAIVASGGMMGRMWGPKPAPCHPCQFALYLRIDVVLLRPCFAVLDAAHMCGAQLKLTRQNTGAFTIERPATYFLSLFETNRLPAYTQLQSTSAPHGV